MSKYYDDDDMYDYDDYDSPYDESYDQGNYGDNSNESAAVVSATVYHNPAEPPSDYVQFVMETLGTVEITTAGTRIVGITSESRVLQMLEAFSFDLDATISYFMKQRETSKVSIAKKVKSKPASESAVTVAVDKKISIKQKEIKSIPTKKITVASQDLNAMGFDIGSAVVRDKSASQMKSQMPVASTTSSTSASTTLITSSALLSDDDYESSTPKNRTKAVVSKLEGGLEPPSPTLPHIIMVVAGHVDAGKSTLVGNLLFKAGNVAQRTMHKYEKESQQTGKGSFALAWVMDESQSEREHGVTIDVAEKQLKTEKRCFTILDAPGHRDFIPNMISGATQADVALLVIPASKGEYETSMSDGAQTREHAVLLKALGVKQIIVVVNKMDNLTVPWSHERFVRIKTEVQHLLEELQFSSKVIRFVPLSGLTGENLVTLSPACALNQWYDGPTLMQALDTFKQPVRRMDAPLRAVITSINAENNKGCDVQVSVLQGKVSLGRGVGLASSAGAATVKKILDLYGMPLNVLSAGEKGLISLIDRSNRSGEEMCLREGMILSKGPPLPSKCLKFKATLLTMSGLQPPIIPGSTYELYLHGEVIQCCITKLYSMNNHNSVGSKEKIKIKPLGGGPSNIVNKKDRKENPKCIPGGRCAKVKIEVQQSICIEPFKISDALGRFALRTKGKTCAVGICEKVKKSDL